MKTFVAALVTAGAAVAAGSAPAQSGYPATFAPYHYSGQARAHHAHDANCADGSCATGGLVSEYGHDECGPDCDPVVPHEHIAGFAHEHAAGCAGDRCGHAAPRTQAGHLCSGDDCDHSSLAGTTALNRRPTYRVGSGDPQQRPASASSLRPAMTRPATRYSSGQSFPGGTSRPTMNNGFQTDRPLGRYPRTTYPPRSVREVPTQPPTSLGGGQFREGTSDDGRPW